MDETLQNYKAEIAKDYEGLLPGGKSTVLVDTSEGLPSSQKERADNPLQVEYSDLCKILVTKMRSVWRSFLTLCVNKQKFEC